MEHKFFLLLAVALLLAMQPAAIWAEENSAELKIESITTPIKAGETLQFSFIAGNRAGPPCSAQIQYWFEVEGERFMQGKDTVYLGTGEAKSESASLIMQPGIEGIRDFYLELECNDATVLASRVIHISAGTPMLPQLKNLAVPVKEDGEQLAFSYTVASSSSGTVQVQVEEKLVQDSNVIWSNSQNIAVTGSAEINGFGPIVSAGNYRLVVEAEYAGKTASMTREFSVKAIEAPLLQLQPGNFAFWAIIAGIGILGAALFVAAGYLGKRQYNWKKIPSAAMAAEKAGAEPHGLAQAKSVACFVESESKGALDEEKLNELLDLARIREGSRVVAAEFAGRTPVAQAVRSCIVTDAKGGITFETTVEISIENNGNRNWTGIAVIAKLPSFLGDSLSEVSANTVLHVAKKGKLLRFDAQKIGAMHSATISYKLPRLISQEEANSIPLPAVIGYEESEPLVITSVKVEKENEKLEKVALAGLERREKKNKAGEEKKGE